MVPRILYLGLTPPPGVIHYPVIRTEIIRGQDLLRALAEWPQFSHVVFTSKTTVRYWFEIQQKFDKIALAIGDATAKELRLQGVDPLIASDATQEGMIELIARHKPSYLFFPRSKCARSALSDYLRREGIRFLGLDLYDTILQRSGPPIDLSEIDEIVFTSPSTVRGFIAIYGALPKDKILTSIGPVTQSAIERETKREQLDIIL